jgi:hypothetical protein
MKPIGSFNKGNRKLFKNTGSKSLYNEIEPKFIYGHRYLFIVKNEKASFYRNYSTPTLNNGISPTPSLYTNFWRRCNSP